MKTPPSTRKEEATMQTEKIGARKINNVFGAEIDGINLANITDSDAKWISRKLAEHALLVFHDQQLNAGQIATIGKKLGIPKPHILLKYRVPAHPEVSMLTNVDANGKTDPFGVTRAAVWHTDMTYSQELPIMAMLHSLQVPSTKGGTMFCDMRAAYDALPSQKKELLEKLTAVHGAATGPLGHRRGKTGNDPTHDPKQQKEARHPAIRVHPVSGRRVLFVNPMHTAGFDGMPEAEAVRLIEELAAHSVKDEFVHYHQWRKGDVVMWDETSTMHKNAGDYNAAEPRVFMRTIVFPQPGLAA